MYFHPFGQVFCSIATTVASISPALPISDSETSVPIAGLRVGQGGALEN